LIEKIAKMEGIGAWFRDGILGAAKKIGLETQDLIVHVKNLDYPAHDPRFAVSLGINYAIGTRGACHIRGPVMDSVDVSYPELFKGELAKDNIENAPRRTYLIQNINSFYNQVSLCWFMIVFGGG
jgi:aldehyde:ferredoxin oxidoreductase